MTSLSSFYDRYHQKNNKFTKVISENNFTYFYILEFLHQADFARLFRDKRVLDIGCGVGTLALFIAQWAKQVTGIDVSPRAIKLAEDARSQIKQANASFKRQELTAKIGTFDTIMCTEVIEHIADDAQFLRLIHKNLKPKGFLFLSTPSSENMLFRSGFYRQFDQEVGHLRRYTEQSISTLLQKQGFKVLKIRSVEGPLRNILFTTKLGFLIRFIRGPFIPLFHALDRVAAKMGGAADIQVLAQKK